MGWFIVPRRRDVTIHGLGIRRSTRICGTFCRCNGVTDCLTVEDLTAVSHRTKYGL